MISVWRDDVLFACIKSVCFVLQQDCPVDTIDHQGRSALHDAGLYALLKSAGGFFAGTEYILMGFWCFTCLESKFLFAGNVGVQLRTVKIFSCLYIIKNSKESADTRNENKILEALGQLCINRNTFCATTLYSSRGSDKTIDF